MQVTFREMSRFQETVLQAEGHRLLAPGTRHQAPGTADLPGKPE